jgi:hypothetical protein
VTNGRSPYVLHAADQNHYLAFILGALAAGVSALVAWLNYRRTHDSAAVAALLPEAEKLRDLGVFTDALAIVEAIKSPSWRVIGDSETRDRVGKTLARVCKQARVVDSPAAWHAVLESWE